LTFAIGETATTLTDKATSNVDTSKSGTATVTVNSMAATVNTVTVSPPTPTVPRGGTQTFTATVTGTDSPVQTVTWSIVESVVTGTTIGNTNGVLTIAAGETAATLTIRATSTVDNTKFGTTTVTVSDPPVSGPTVSSVTVSPPTPTVAKGETQTFIATVTGTGNPAQTVLWSIEGADVTGTTIDSMDGVLTIAAGETAASLTVRATSTVDTTKSGTATVIVSGPTVSSVTVNPPTSTVAQGATQPFIATVTGTGNPAQTVTWTVEGAAVSGTTIGSNGVLTIAAGETAATLTVRATSTVDTGKSGTATVIVSAPPDNPTALVSVSFTGPEDETITLTGVENTLSAAANTPITVSVTGTYTAYRWALDGEEIWGETGMSLTRYAGSLEVKRHTLTVFVTTSAGIEYAKRVTFTVTN
jgi:hypothetical protein